MTATKSSSMSTATIVAPSALNVYKKIAVVRTVDDILHFEVNGSVRTVSVQDLGDAISTATPLVVPRPKLEIPVPHLTVNDTYHRDVPANYELPRSYVRYHRVTSDEFMARLDYVADLEDEEWLESNTKFGGAVDLVVDEANNGAMEDEQKDKDMSDLSFLASLEPIYRPPQLSITLFETMLDVLEKKTGFESIVTMQQAEQFILERIPQLTELFPTPVLRNHLPGASVSTPVTSRTVMQDVYHYWVQKRSKLKRPLLRNYWPVTSTEDTNPHLVFRPREKEKYRLRKKRQNDFAAFEKLQQLRNDFESLRTVLRLVKRREELQRTQCQLRIDLFRQRLSNVVDTSGRPRRTTSSRAAVKRELEESALIDLHGRKNKRCRSTGAAGRGFDTSGNGQGRVGAIGNRQNAVEGQDASAALNVAGRNFGEPAPNFLQPLSTRESYKTSWCDSVPNVATYVDSHLEQSTRFRNRPRIGRGGRVCIDRIPLPVDPSFEPPIIVTVGKGLPNYAAPKERLLDLLPKPLDHRLVSRQIENICIAAVKDDVDRAKYNMPLDQEENDGAEVIVDANQWLGTDEQLWGEERYTVFLR
ncbi:hypothetical protein MPSEU_000961900 [Mayamaea pseudoterrestris]|nr:hypothetical protein MPSEU_000961900 [Mayamaea pseudoterrestris]